MNIGAAEIYINGIYLLTPST